MPNDVNQIDPKSVATGNGESAGGTAGQGHVNPDDNTPMVPKARLDQALGKYHDLQTQVATLQGRFDELSKGQAAQPEPPRYTRAQLDKAVEDGQCTQEQADDIRDGQQQREIERTVRDTVKATMQVETRTGTVGDQLAAYRRLVPEAFEAGSDAQAALQRETEFQVGTLGLDPENPATDLAVVRARYGPLESLKAAKGKNGTPETHPDTGSDRAGGGGSGGNADGAPKGLSARRRAHYQKGIDSGLYKGWEAVAKELEHAKPGVLSRADARAAA